MAPELRRQPWKKGCDPYNPLFRNIILAAMDQSVTSGSYTAEDLYGQDND